MMMVIMMNVMIMVIEVMKIAMIVGHDKNCIDDYANCL
jgi:hypothetical protein